MAFKDSFWLSAVIFILGFAIWAWSIIHLFPTSAFYESLAQAGIAVAAIAMAVIIFLDNKKEDIELPRRLEPKKEKSGWWYFGDMLTKTAGGLLGGATVSLYFNGFVLKVDKQGELIGVFSIIILIGAVFFAGGYCLMNHFERP